MRKIIAIFLFYFIHNRRLKVQTITTVDVSEVKIEN